MMTWNHRLLVRNDGTARLVEVYYDDEGAIFGWHNASLGTDGTAADLRDELGMLFTALDAATPLAEKDLPGLGGPS